MRAKNIPRLEVRGARDEGCSAAVEIGPRDVKASQAVLVRRDIRTKEIAALSDLPTRIPALLERYKPASSARQKNSSTKTSATS